MCIVKDYQLVTDYLWDNGAKTTSSTPLNTTSEEVTMQNAMGTYKIRVDKTIIGSYKLFLPHGHHQRLDHCSQEL